MWNQRKEALAMFRVCTLVRDQLNKEHEAGDKMDDIVQRLIGFYQATCPRLAAVLLENPMSARIAHTSSVMHMHLQIPLAHDESIDFKALREYIAATWPDMDIEGTLNPPTKPVFFTQDGKEVCADPNFNVLLEKVATDWSEVSSEKVNPFGTPTPDGGEADDKIIKR